MRGLPYILNATINAMTTMGCQVVRPAVQAQPISGTCRYMFVQEVTPPVDPVCQRYR